MTLDQNIMPRQNKVSVLLVVCNLFLSFVASDRSESCDKIKIIGANETCPGVGDFADPLDCTIFYKCIRGPEGLKASRSYCAKGYNFTGDSCEPGENTECFQLVCNYTLVVSMEPGNKTTAPVLPDPILSMSEENDNSNVTFGETTSIETGDVLDDTLLQDIDAMLLQKSIQINETFNRLSDKVHENHHSSLHNSNSASMNTEEPYADGHRHPGESKNYTSHSLRSLAEESTTMMTLTGHNSSGRKTSITYELFFAVLAVLFSQFV